MPLWSAPLAVKATLKAADGEKAVETRRVVLPSASAKFAEALALMGSRFGRTLAREVRYVDEDGETITVSTDEEWKEALAMGVQAVEVAEAGGWTRSPSDGDGWELVGAPAAASAAKAALGGATWSRQVQFWVNGEEVTVTNPSPNVRLLDWLREVKGLHGMHVGCHEGGCGICTVALSKMDAQTKQVELVAINSCLRRLCAVDGCHIITTQGLGCKDKGFHPIQSAIAAGNGSQCGFCTPGWVMNMYALLEKGKTPSAEEIEKHFDGNLCRCTGYRPILSSFGTFAKGGSRCGQHQSIRHPAGMLSHVSQPLHFVDEATGEEWYRPLTLYQYMSVASQTGGKTLRPMCASTADGIAKYVSKPGDTTTGMVYVDISALPELYGMKMDSDGAFFGAAVPMEKVIDFLQSNSAQVPAYKVLASHIKYIACTQIRSVASWAGNVMFTRLNPQFQSDMVTILAAAGATFDVLSQDSKVQSMNITDLLAAKGDVLLMSMVIPKIPLGTVFQTFKTAQRHVFSHAIVNFGASIALDSKTGAVKSARLMIAGATQTLLEASGAASALLGRPLDDATFKLAAAALKKDIATNPSQSSLNTPEYRNQLALSLLYKTFLSARPNLPPQLKSAIVPFITAEARPISRGSEDYGTDASASPVGQYVAKLSAFIQASGEAVFPSDVSRPGALFGQLVLSSAANAKLVALDPSEALKMPGVFDFVVASAIPGLNCVNGPAGGDNLKEKLFFEVNDVIPADGMPLGLIVAETWRQARDAALKVVQRYAAVGPVISSLEEAIQVRSTMPGFSADDHPHRRRGANPRHAAGIEFAAADGDGGAPKEGATMALKGSFKVGGQCHFYMETQSVCASQYDGDCWEVVVGDQDSNFTQGCLALILGIPQHKINVKVPRIGGAFGGKLSRHMFGAGAAVVAAKALGRPVRIQNERSDDMRLVGGREPLQFDYSVSFEPSGKLDSNEITMTMDPGWFYGDAAGDMAMAVGWSDNCYSFKKFKVNSQAALTNTLHRTSMRAPGCMQSILAAEVIMEHIAKTVGRPLDEVQEMNFYQVGEQPTTPFGDHIGQDNYNWTIPTLWSQIQKSARYTERKKVVEAYNAANRWTKKGIAISPVKYPMGIDSYSSGALVCIYGDGTVMVSTGGSEMGQGLDTKVALCVASALNVPLARVVVGARETQKIPDNTGTGGSGTSECSCEAAILACQKLVPLLQPYLDQQKDWDTAVAAAIVDKVGLVATGWYNFKKSSNTSAYATYGTAVAEATIDVLTGEVQVDRLDVLMDLGNQLDAAVDIGQLQGGFVIALGYLLTEEQKHDKKGIQLNLGTWDYKIPTAYDIPLEFNVSLLKDSPNPNGIKGSKASAEPAMCLLPSVYLAIKNAIYAARSEKKGNEGWFMLNVPLTPEVIRSTVGVTEEQLTVPT